MLLQDRTLCCQVGVTVTSEAAGARSRLGCCPSSRTPSSSFSLFEAQSEDLTRRHSAGTGWWVTEAVSTWKYFNAPWTQLCSLCRETVVFLQVVPQTDAGRQEVRIFSFSVTLWGSLSLMFITSKQAQKSCMAAQRAYESQYASESDGTLDTKMTFSLRYEINTRRPG